MWSVEAAGWWLQEELLTVEADVMVGEDGGPVAFGHAPHGDVQHAVGRLHVVLLGGAEERTGVSHHTAWPLRPQRRKTC